MITAEEKLDLLVAEVKALQIDQLKLVTTVDSINTWSVASDKTSTELDNSIKSLTSRIEALEAATIMAPSQAPPREEGGRANGHRIATYYQGTDGRNSTLHHTLVKGEHNYHNASRVLDLPESSYRRDVDSTPHHKDYKLPRLDFPRFDGSHPRI